jgi:hypothetical protein
MNEKLLKALIAAGLNPGLAAVFASISKEVKDEEIESIVKIIVEGAGNSIAQAEIDRRVTQAVKTAVENYEKKYNIKDGKPIDETKADPPKTDPPKDPSGNPKNQEIEELKKMVIDLTTVTKGLQQKTLQDERKSKIKKALSEAKIPEPLQKYFPEKDYETEDELITAVTTYKQEMMNVGISGLTEPGKGGAGISILEQNAKHAAEFRNKGGDTVNGIVPGKKL